MKTPLLAVDDDPDVLQFITLALERGGYRVETAENGSACLSKMRAGFNGLLDIMMPGMNGWDVVKQLAAENLLEGNLICMLTAKHSVDPVLGRFAPYVIEHLRNPFEPKP